MEVLLNLEGKMEEVEPEEVRELEEEEEEKPRIDELVRLVSLPSLSLQVPITAVQMSTQLSTFPLSSGKSHVSSAIPL